MNENVCIFIHISLNFAAKDPVNNNPALVQVMVWHQPGDKPLSEPIMVYFTDAYMRHVDSIGVAYVTNIHLRNKIILSQTIYCLSQSDNSDLEGEKKIGNYFVV